MTLELTITDPGLGNTTWQSAEGVYVEVGIIELLPAIAPNTTVTVTGIAVQDDLGAAIVLLPRALSDISV